MTGIMCKTCKRKKMAWSSKRKLFIRQNNVLLDICSIDQSLKQRRVLEGLHFVHFFIQNGAVWTLKSEELRK